jgi:hypothetical protein
MNGDRTSPTPPDLGISGKRGDNDPACFARFFGQRPAWPKALDASYKLALGAIPIRPFERSLR